MDQLQAGEMNEKSPKRVNELYAECFRAAWAYAILHYGYDVSI